MRKAREWAERQKQQKQLEQTARLAKKTYKPHTKYQELYKMNIKSSKKINSNEKLSVIKRLEGNIDVYSFGHNNFYTITRYNRSRLYALAVYSLAQEIKMPSQ